MTALESDLAPVYGPTTEHAVGMTRGTVAELAAFHRKALDQLEQIVTGCVQCAHKRGRVCQHWGATMPDDYAGLDCDAWKYDGVPW